MAFPEKRIREIYAEHGPEPDSDKVIEAVAKEFGWTRGQAYWATEFLFRPKKNYN